MNHQTFKKKTGAIFSKEIFSVLFAVLFLHACTNVGQVRNQPIESVKEDQQYSAQKWNQNFDYSELTILLSFSGGGTRAAAFAYGVMQELKNTNIAMGGRTPRILDHVKAISSVSGGSFTAAYYGLNGDEIFETFESDFLRADLDKHLELVLINPTVWATKTSRTDKAIEYYEEHIFHNGTFADMVKPGRPMIVINATDLSHGTRFSFIQDYFNLLCSDLSSFSVARAVTASSAVPIFFEPVVVKNFSGCDGDAILKEMAARAANQEGDAALLIDRLGSYGDKEQRKFIHFVDGGLVDNLGLRALADSMKIHGGVEAYFQDVGKQVPRRFVIIEVNAATGTHRNMDLSPEQPHVSQVVSAVTDMQIQKGDAESVQSAKDLMANWSEKLSTPGHPVSGYLVQVELAGEEAKSHFLSENVPLNIVSHMPTNFSLSDEQVDFLITEGGHLLRINPVYQQLLSELAKP
jgi:NTE family protein